MRRRRILFVTGTRAEFGLMEHALRCVRAEPGLDLSIVATGMHLSRSHGYSLNAIRAAGWTVDGTVPWKGGVAEATGSAMAGLAKHYQRLDPDIVLVVGDRVEAIAAASAAHLDGRVVAHAHGGDRALGQVDDALRHAISKLSHLHFAATRASAARLHRMGEDAFRVYCVGTPGLDDLATRPDVARDDFALVLLHPDGQDERRQHRQAKSLLAALKRCGVRRLEVVASNNDPGWPGIAAAWQAAKLPVHANLQRPTFLRLMASAAFLIGNSSSGIIEAASVGTRVINIGDRQLGRERSANVVDVPWQADALEAAVRDVWNGGRPKSFRGRNVYGGGTAGRSIARLLAATPLDDTLRRKLIRY